MRKAEVDYKLCGSKVKFYLVDTEFQETITEVDPGEIEDNVNWNFVDDQAKKLGYTIFF